MKWSGWVPNGWNVVLRPACSHTLCRVAGSRLAKGLEVVDRCGVFDIHMCIRWEKNNIVTLFAEIIE